MASPMTNQTQTVRGDHAQDIGGLRTERHAHADFLGPLANVVIHHAVQA